MAPLRSPGVLVLVALALLMALLVDGPARSEQTQRGNLIAALDGHFSPLSLPRDRSAPVSLRLRGGLRTDDGSPLPRVVEVEFGLPAAGALTTKGLPVCSLRFLRNATSRQALARCGGAVLGRGILIAEVTLPHQRPFPERAGILAFNGRVDGRRAVLLHAFSHDPPSTTVLPLVLHRQAGRFGRSLVGYTAKSLSPWTRLARFDLTLFRRYRYQGKLFSYLSASCPIPGDLTAGFFSFARVRFALAGGRHIEQAITRGCRAR